MNYDDWVVHDFGDNTEDPTLFGTLGLDDFQAHPEDNGYKGYDGYKLVQELEAFLRTKVWFGDGDFGRLQLVAYMLFVLGTYTFQYGQRAPRLIVGSARKRSGKTLLIADLTPRLVKHPRVYGGTSARAILNDLRDFATGENRDEVPVGMDRPTIIVDETDTIFAPNRDQEDLRSVLNNGWRRGMAISRAGDGGDVSRNVRMEPFAPVVLAGISNGLMPDTVTDRGITITLHRASDKENLEEYWFEDDDPILDDFGVSIAAWMDDKGRAERLGTTRVPKLDGLHARAREVWQPLFAIADELGGEYPDLARRAALGVTIEEADDDSVETRLLTDLRTVFRARNVWWMSNADICAALIALNNGWNDYDGRRREVGGRDLAIVLRKYGVKSLQHRPCPGMVPVNGYKMADLTPVWDRYLGGEKEAA